jgi:hypothetical protein
MERMTIVARITDISFDSVGKREGCTCDRCGQWLQNIWTVKFDDGITAHFGIDCYKQMCKDSRLTDYGMKLMKKTLKRIENFRRMRAEFENMTAETCVAWQNEQAEWNDSYWKGKSFEEYKQWMLEAWFPARFADCQKELEKFSKVNFQR